MPRYEYKVVPAPKKGLRGRGVKGVEGRFANALATVMNELGNDGWEYQRTDTLPSEERKGLTGKVTTYQNMLVFRRMLEEVVIEDEKPSLVAAAVGAVAAETVEAEAYEAPKLGGVEKFETTRAPIVLGPAQMAYEDEVYDDDDVPLPTPKSKDVAAE